MEKTCPICGATLVEAAAESIAACTLCGTQEQSHLVCPKGHHVCEACRAEGIAEILPLCRAETSRNPIEILEKMMALPFCPMHGPVHHILVGAALLTACRNAGGAIDLETALPEIFRRGKAVPGAACGLWGACGAGLSAGMYLSILTGSGPLAEEVWSLGNRMTSTALAHIAAHGGPRCCKRDSYLAIQSAVAFTAEHLGIRMELGDIRCSRSHLNRQCRGTACPFFAGEQGEEIV